MAASPRQIVIERYSDGFRGGGDHDRIPDCLTDDPLATLSPRERDVLALVAEEGFSKAIADRLRTAERTVEAHITQILGASVNASNNDGRSGVRTEQTERTTEHE